MLNNFERCICTYLILTQLDDVTSHESTLIVFSCITLNELSSLFKILKENTFWRFYLSHRCLSGA